MRQNRRSPYLPACAALGLVGSTLLAPAALGAALEEVVVTAQKKIESLQQAPISIAAFSQQALEQKGINNLVDMRTSVPNLQVGPHPNSGATARVFIRGIGNNDDQLTQDPSVAIYLDGVYMARSQGLAMEVGDIERIEVLRGPQGALYGRNATGGAINFITSAPALDRFAFKQELTLGNRDLLRTKTVVNAPLADTLAAKLTLLTVRRDGFVDNPGTGEDTFGSQNRRAGRIDLRWQPTALLDIRYAYDRSEVDDSSPYITPVPLHPDKGDRPSRGSPFVRNFEPNDIVAQGHSITLDWQLADALSLKSITAYRELDNVNYQDYNTGVNGPNPILTTWLDLNQEQWSQEFQLSGAALDDQIEYLVGLYYFSEQGDSFDSTTFPGWRTELRRIEVENTAHAAYGQLTWSPAAFDRRLHVTLGARWSEDEREAELQTGLRPAGGVDAYGAVTPAKKSYDDFSPSLAVRYDLDGNTNIYGKVVTGYKTGGYNVRASSPDRFSAGFDPETLTSYELGFKSELFDNRLRMNLAVFYADYDDIQVNIASDPTRPTVSDVLNAGKAELSGFELDVTALLTDNLTLTLNYGYIDTDYTEMVSAAGVDVSPLFHFINAPRNAYAVGLEYRFPALPFGQLSALVNYTYQDEAYSVASVAVGKFLMPNYGLLDARLSLSEISLGAAGELRFALWGRNINDKEYYLTHFNGGVPSAIFGEPRSYGLDVIYEY